MKNVRLLLVFAAVNGFLAVAFGAFAAHGLKDVLSASALITFHKGVDYQGMHALAMLAAALLEDRSPGQGAALAGWLFLLGCVLFSGSLYLLAGLGIRGLGIITPFGGVSFLLGWLALARAGWRLR